MEIPAGDSLLGQILSHYRVLERLGEGGMGRVYLAEDTHLERKVVLKFLLDELEQDPVARKRFLQEAKSSAALDHPFICKTYETGELAGRAFISMEYVEGITLARKCAGGALQYKEALEVGREIAEALESAHRRRIVHRDLKPANVMLTREGHVKVLDFGLAKRLGEDSQAVTTALTRQGTALGTVPYMSPEQVRGRVVDERSDIFSFGVLLYEILTGHHPFQRSSSTNTADAILHEEPEPLARYCRESSELLQHTLSRMLAKDPAQRYQSIHEVHTNLVELARRVASGEAQASSGRRAARGRRTPWGVVAALAAVLVLGTLGYLGYLAWRGQRAPQAPLSRVSPVRTQATFTGQARYPSISPDGNFLAYVTSGDKLMVQDLSGGQPISLVQAPLVGGPRWSPDGSRIVVYVAEARFRGALIIPRLGGAARRLPGPSAYACWSPDGSSIATTDPASHQIRITNLKSGETKAVHLSGFRWLAGLDWAPNREWLLLTTQTPSRSTSIIWRVRADGSEQQRLFVSSSFLQQAHWSPDGQAVYCFRPVGDSQELIKILPAATSAHAPQVSVLLSGVTSLSDGMDSLGVSADGSRLAYTALNSYANLWLVEVSGQDGAKPAMRQITEGTAPSFSPAISPDGAWIAFVRRGNIFKIPLEGGAEQQVSFSKDMTSPAWSPDGRRIAFGSQRGGKLGVWVMSADGGAPRVVVEDGVSDSLDVSWSAGNRIFYQVAGNRNYSILDPETMRQERLVEDDSPGWIFSPHVSPDGSKIAFLWNRAMSSEATGIWITSAAGLQGPLLRGLYLPVGWSRDGNSIYAVADEPSGPGNSLLKVSVRGGEPEIVLTLPGGIDSAAVSRDGRHIVCDVRVAHTDIWMVEHFDPALEASLAEGAPRP